MSPHTLAISKATTYAGHDHTWVGEFGHMIIDPAGPPCNCGRRGCWELYVCDRGAWQRYDANLGISNIVFGLNPQRVVHLYPARFVPEVLSLQGAIVLALQRAFAAPKLG